MSRLPADAVVIPCRGQCLTSQTVEVFFANSDRLSSAALRPPCTMALERLNHFSGHVAPSGAVWPYHGDYSVYCAESCADNAKVEEKKTIAEHSSGITFPLFVHHNLNILQIAITKFQSSHMILIPRLKLLVKISNLCFVSNGVV